MSYINRQIEELIRHTLAREKSILLLGPRQTGKTTLIDSLERRLLISLVKPATRLLYEKDLSLLEREIEALPSSGSELPLICLDEIQKVPALFDSVQDLIDRKKAKFILTGSSARKLRRGKSVNLLPGRVV